MENVYFYCAVIGGGFLLFQTLLLLLGGDAHHPDGDLHMDLDANAGHGLDEVTQAHEGFLKVLSLKAIVAFVTFFGLVGLGGDASGWSPTTSLLAAIAAGITAIYIVAWMMRALTRLQSSGTLNMSNAMGTSGKVYTRIPGARAGVGRVTLSMQGRLVECKATTAGNDLISGTPVRVIKVGDDGTVEVEPVQA